MSRAASSAFARAEQSVRRRTSVSPRIVQESLFAESPSLTLRPSYLEEKYNLSHYDLGLLKTPLLRVEDTEELGGRPTVLLVRKSSSSGGLDDSYGLEPIGRPAFLEFVPLTPRPELQARKESAVSALTRISEVPRLPTPDFVSPRLGVHDYLHDGTVRQFQRVDMGIGIKNDMRVTSPTSFSNSWVKLPSDSAAIPTPFRTSTPQSKGYPTASTPGSSKPTQACTIAKSKSGSQRSHASSNSSASATAESFTSYMFGSILGRSSLIPGISTTEKFTHRWPEPKYMQRFKKARHKPDKSSYDKLSLCPEDLAALTDSEIGLGFERLGQWSRPKWVLFLSVLSLLGYSIGALTYAIVTWYRAWDYADVMLVADSDILILITLCAILMLTSALVGLTGTLLNSRPILAVYAILLWPALISLLTVGYMSYKRAAFALDRKLNLAWSQWYTDIGRQVIQDSLRCCGFYDAVHEAVVTQRCYPRTPLPGCKGPLLRFERDNLTTLWTLTFSFLPLHLINIFVALLCANHVTNTFGKGLMPKKYRLRVEDVRANAHSLLTHFADSARRPPMARSGSSAVYFREDKIYS